MQAFFFVKSAGAKKMRGLLFCQLAAESEVYLSRLKEIQNQGFSRACFITFYTPLMLIEFHLIYSPFSLETGE